MEEKKYRLYASERETMVRVHVMLDLAAQIKSGLTERRIKAVPGLARDLGLMAALPRRILDGLKMTVPDDQLRSLNRNLAGAGYTVGVKRPGKDQHKDDFGIWLSYGQFETLLNALHEHCLVCDLDPQIERACRLRKVFDQIGVDVDHHGGRCGYRQYI